MLKNLLFSAAMLLPITALAAPVGVTLSPNKAITTYHGAPLRSTLPQWIPPTNAVAIINTFGPAHAYNCCSGWTISVPGGVGLQWIAYPITPTAGAAGLRVVEAIGYVQGGDSVTIALLADNGGVPGAVLSQKTKANLETFGQCCTVAVADLDVPVTAGTTYWVGALLPRASQSTTWDAWNFSTKAGIPTNTPFAYYNGSWNATTGSYAAFAVYGQ